MSLEIIIKTCDGESIHGNNSERFCQTDKKTLIIKCVSSILYAVSGRNESTKITIIDDASSEECVESLKKLLEKYRHPSQLFVRDYRDYNEATLQYFELARESEKTMVYLVEDDYLHFPNAIAEMESFYKHSFNQLHATKDIVLHPFDDPDNYLSRYMEKSHIVQHSGRHWRTNYYTTCTFFTTPGVMQRGWEYFEQFANNYRKDPTVCENTTINRVWDGDNVQLFTPMPSLALHMQFEANRDKMINWKKLWNLVPEMA
jgi:hypothetical protein